MMMAGTLYIVATPIGNLEDMSARGIRILRTVDYIAAEDTRRTRKLLSALDIHTPLTSYHGHNELEKGEALLQTLVGGKSIALVSDAGTPGISDPGTRLVEEARGRGVAVVPIPGPSAIVTALSAAGVPTTRFTFVGFLPGKRSRRRVLLTQLAALHHTVVLYVAPWDVAKYLPEMEEVFGDRDVVLCRELTKVHEEFRRSTMRALRVWATREKVRGEITLIIVGEDAG
ncbi:MAG: 16S rRNA (cytidine(1402)-2'-O)-methyltransferase [Deltaproteobacteria bacterium]|nr:16S rRNA (cytidine(1402)-2'-O)-methyltransferase [Deltaproteobacteria bacterium]